MSRRKVFAGTASMTLSINVQDTSSTTGGGLGGLTNTTPGLVFEYRRQGESSWTNIPLVSGTLGSYLSGSIVANGALAGRYEIGIPNAAIASGARFVELQLRGAANMLPVLIEFELDAVNYQDAVGFGLSRLDATVGSRSTQTSVDTLLGRITAPVAQMFQDLIAMITGSGSVDAQFDAKALELGPGGGGGGAGDASQATLLLVKAKTDLITSQSVFVTVDRVSGATITMYYNESTSVTVPIDENTTGLTLRFVVENADGLDVLVIETASITRTSTNFTVTITTAVTATLGQYKWALRDITGGINRLVEGGVLQVQPAANKD